MTRIKNEYRDANQKYSQYMYPIYCAQFNKVLGNKTRIRPNKYDCMLQSTKYVTEEEYQVEILEQENEARKRNKQINELQEEETALLKKAIQHIEDISNQLIKRKK
jgi:hypothetical protein